MNVLLTGGAGYIGSHTAVALSKEGHHPIILDNFSNSNVSVIKNINNITLKPIIFYDGDIRDTKLVKYILEKNNTDAVIHFAALKSVEDSCRKPIEYYSNNIEGSISLLKAMNSTGVKKLVFSSSATVYGEPQYLPIDENHPLQATSPYGRTKIQMEEILFDLTSADKKWKIVCLRYFNPIGAHSSGLIGDNPNNVPSNLMPNLVRVATGKLPFLNIYGQDYSTPDGTCIRDFIHVMDLAEGHLAALEKLSLMSRNQIINLGTGRGYSVFEIVKETERILGKKIPIKIKEKRLGDISMCYADVTLAKHLLNWNAKRSLNEMCSNSLSYERHLKN